MKQPIVINTRANIVLVGTVLSKNGLIMCTPQNSASINGTAHDIYTNEIGIEDSFDGIKVIRRFKKKYSFLWTKNYMIANRYNNFLLVVEGDISLHRDPELKASLPGYLGDSITDASMELGIYASYSHQDQLNAITYEGLRAYFTWEFSKPISIIEKLLGHD